MRPAKETTLNNVDDYVILQAPGMSNKPNSVVKVVRLTKTLAICTPVGALWSVAKEVRLERWRYTPARPADVDAALKYFADAKGRREREKKEQEEREASPHWQAAHRVSNVTCWDLLSLDKLQQIVKWLDELHANQPIEKES